MIISIPNIVQKTPEDYSNIYHGSLGVERSEDKNSVIFNGTIESEFLHRNYLEYLNISYKYHFGIVVDPKLFWHLILSEVSSLVKNSPEKYRNLFTDSEDVVEICVETDNLFLLPLDKVIKEINKIISTELFFPDFSTRTNDYDFAINATFCDLVSPYYNYSMYCCGFPKVYVKGANNDWELLYNRVKELFSHLELYTPYTERVIKIFKILSNKHKREDPNTWEEMFFTKECGSGSQIEIFGWVTELFVDIPSYKLIENYSTNISVVEYKNLITNKKFKLTSGLFCSNFSDGVLLPKFNYYINEIPNN